MGVLLNDALNCEVYSASITYEYESLVQGRRYSENSCRAALSTINPTWTVPGSKPPPPRLVATIELCDARLL